jgi:AcrR family transcriptional regulator
MASQKPTQSPALTARKGPKQQRSKKMVETILEAAARILEDGVQPFTTNHIAERAGVSIGSLYQYFPGADAIMAAMLEKHVADERAAAEAILATANDTEADLLRELLLAFVSAHGDRPRLTARLHSLAASFDLQDHLAQARDAQAARIAEAMKLPASEVLMSVMAVEGVVLATLASHPARLRNSTFIDQLYAIALAPLSSVHFSAASGDPGKAPR